MIYLLSVLLFVPVATPFSWSIVHQIMKHDTFIVCVAFFTGRRPLF